MLNAHKNKFYNVFSLTVPGVVNGLRVNVINTLSAQVLWRAPTVTNGRIRVYTAELYVKGNELIQTQVVLPTESLEAVFNNLGKKINLSRHN